MKITIAELLELELDVLIQRPSNDYSALTSTDIETFRSKEQNKTKVDKVLSIWQGEKIKNNGEGTPPNGAEYYDDVTGEIKEYIPLDRLRFLIEETAKREIGDDFVLGKKAWEEIIKHPTVSLGERVENSYVAYDDIDNKYKAEHPKSKQQGFNAKNIQPFYDEKISAILFIKEIVDDAIEEENVAKQQARQKQAKLKRQREKKLNSYGGLI